MSREELTREERLAEMLESADALATEWREQAESYRVELEVARDKLAAAERACEAAIAGNSLSTQRARDAEQRADDIGRLGKEHIEQLRELLGNEEKKHAFTKSEHALERNELLRQCDLLRGERDAAEVRVGELEASLKTAQKFNSNFLRQRGETEQQLAAANALLRDIWDNGDLPQRLGRRIKAHLSAQPAAPSRAGFDCKPGSTGYCDGCSVCQPALPTDHDAAVAAALARREAKRG